MAQRNEWAVKKTLDVVEIEVQLIGKYVKVVTTTGRCRAKRDKLWVDTYDPAKRDHVQNTVSHLTWLLGGVLHERPVDMPSLVACWSGEAAPRVEEPPLPL